MLKIHKLHSKKLSIISITFILSICTLLGISYLTYTPELSHAETITYDPIPRYHPNIYDITYMQDMTEQVCQNSYENDTKQLIDKRDSKTYWVTKLKDDNCWMTQNLDLDITANGLSKDNTDIETDWNDTTNSTYPPVATQTGSPNEFNEAKGNNVVLSYDPGEYIYTTPTVQNRCDSNNGLIDCINKNWQQIINLSKDVSGNEQAHYLAGNYYTFNAATAGKGASKLSGNIENSSICPKGWQLPTSNNTKSKSFGGLLAAYGSINGINAGTQDIRLGPLHLVYGGMITNSSSLASAGSTGYYWSSTGINAGAYFLYFTTGIYPSSSLFLRYNGMSVRCVARGEPVKRPAVPAEDNVTVNINPQISIDVVDEVVVEKGENNPATADLNVKVSSNQKYTLGISARNPNLTSSTSNVKILAKDGLLNTTENGWGIKLKDDTEFTALSNTSQTFYTASGAEIKTIPFTIGISTAPDIPNGEYSTDITVTATQN